MTVRAPQSIKWVFHSLSVAAVCLAGCARIPRQSVELSQSIGSGMAAEHRACVEMVDLYFDQKRERIDQWIEQKYVPTFVANVRTELKAAGKNPDAFDEELTIKLMRRVIQRRNEMQSGLQKTRQALLDKVNANHALLVNANQQLTALLESAADVQDAQSTLATALTHSSRDSIDFNRLDNQLNAWLDTAGDASKSADDLFDQLQSVFNPKQE
jgi:hypothetical protein